MAITTWRWIDTITRHLELCRASSGETASVLSTDTDDPELRSLFALALERLGCRVNEIIVRSGALFDGTDPVDNKAVAAALLHSDLVIDLSGNLLERSRARNEILDEARVLAIDIDSTTELDRLAAHTGLGKRLERAEEALAAGEILRASSLSGTSVRADLTGAGITSASGLVTSVGDLDHWPAGIVWARPNAQSIEGSIIAMPGDILDEAGHLLRSPVRLEVQQGKLVEVLGDTIDADVVRSFLEGVDHDHAYAVTMLGWGMNLTRASHEVARFDPARLAKGRGALTAGQVNIRIGEMGPTNGLTVSLADASMTIDALDVVVEGELAGVVAPDIYEKAAGS